MAKASSKIISTCSACRSAKASGVVRTRHCGDEGPDPTVVLPATTSDRVILSAEHVGIIGIEPNLPSGKTHGEQNASEPV
jgi:hypothetical protein